MWSMVWSIIVGSSEYIDIIVVISNAVTALCTFGLLVAAVSAGRTAVRTMRASQEASAAAREAQEQARRDSIEQTRPYVYVEVVPGLAGLRTYDLRISNSGRSAARDLRLDFDAWPDVDDKITEAIRVLFNTPRTLPPGASIRAYWSVVGGDISGMPESGKIYISYTSDDVTKPRYRDEYEVLITRSGLWSVPGTGPEPRHVKGRDREFHQLGQAIVRVIGNLSR